MRVWLRFCAFFSIFLSLGSVMAQDPWIQVSDVRAGEEIPVQITGLLDSETVQIALKRPSSSDINTSLTADRSGSVHAELPGLYSQLAGDYSLEVLRSVSSRTFKDDFAVVAGPVSAYRSLISLNENAQPADGKSEIAFEVRAYDAFGNAVKGAPVRAFSGQNGTSVIVQPTTDSFGRSKGKAVSSTPGVVNISAMVKDTLIQDKQEVIFHLPTQGMPSVGQGLGDFLRAQIFDDQNLLGLGYFEIENLPSEVTQGEFIGMRVVAYDTNGQIFKDYDGTVEFASTDDQGELPNEYTFENEDQGVHDFDLAVRFGTPGDQTLSVRDRVETLKVGERAIRVLPSNTTTDPPIVTEPGTIVIDTPSNNGLYNTKRLTISGRAPGLSVLQVRFGKAPAYQIATADLQVQPNGTFAYQTPTLIEGYHEVSVASLDNTIESSVVAFTIDATPPESMAVSIDPEGTKQPNDIFNLNLQSSEPLALVQCVFNESIFALNPAGENTYSTQLAAPQECGQYPVGCTVSDEVGNQYEEPNATVVKVCEEGPIVEPGNIAPGAPTNLSGTPDVEKVTLLWSPSVDDGEIKNYRVSFLEEGTTEIQENIVPDNRTQWYVDGLTECVKYRFTVTAIDDQGEESIPSDVVEQAPYCPEELQPAPPKTTDSGGEFPWIVMALSLIIGGTVVSLFRKA